MTPKMSLIVDVISRMECSHFVHVVIAEQACNVIIVYVQTFVRCPHCICTNNVHNCIRMCNDHSVQV